MHGPRRGLMPLVCFAAIGLLGPSDGYGTRSVENKGEFNAEVVLERLKKLEGMWRGEGGTVGGESNSVVHEFRVSAGGSAVLEIMDPEGEREINIYHLEGDDLFMTHYCGGGSQPTLKLERATAGVDALTFLFSRITNLDDPARGRHIHSSKIIFLDQDRIQSWWTVYEEGRKAAVSKFVLVRAAGS